MSDDADVFFHAIKKLEREVEEEEHNVDYLVIIDGILLDERESYSTSFYKSEHRKIIQGIRRHTKKSEKIQRQIKRLHKLYAKALRREGWR